MSSAENGRLVWMNDQEFRDWSYAVDVEGEAGGYIEQACDPLLQRYRDAPADPAEAVRKIIVIGHCFETFDETVERVLSALGVPQRPTPRDETTS